MANEAFALSPISARAVQPSEEDYDAISEAFMETARGRWFLGEYAKRNRNADTRMVLDAVARIEETLAAQRQPPPDSGLAEALAAIAGAVDEARIAAAAALDGLALDESLAPVRKGARVIREIAWRLREIGADGRICDLIDSQVGAIEGACGKISATDVQTALSAAFDLIKARIGEFGDDDVASSEAVDEAILSPSPAPSDETTVAAVETVQPATTTNDAEAAMSAPAMPAEAAAAAEPVVATETIVATEATVATDTVVTTAEAESSVTAEVADVTAETADVKADAAETMAENADITADAATEAAEAYDEAVLDLIAIEMAAPDPSDADDASKICNGEIHGADEIHGAEPPPANPVIVAQTPEPPAAPVQPPEVPPSLQPSMQPSIQPSLGSTLIANGIVRKPNLRDSDPLAPIRRMSQAEKIALFS